MTWDAILVARRGLGADDLRQMTGAMRSAVRWVAVAEQLAPELEAAERVANTDPPDELLGLKSNPEIARQRALRQFKENREKAREEVKRLRDVLFPPDEATE